VLVDCGREESGFAVRRLDKSIAHSDRPLIVVFPVLLGLGIKVFLVATEYTDDFVLEVKGEAEGRGF
jgi:hypothetical protein